MALVVDDRIKETTTTINTGSYSLGGAVSGFQTFSDGVGSGNTTYYCCTDGSDYEIGLGTLSGTTLARTTILESSNSNSAVSWSAGSKDIFCTLPASKAVFKDASNNVTVPNALIASSLDATTGGFDNLVLNKGAGFVAPIIWEGSTQDDYETTLNVVDPTADRTISLPDASGTVALNDVATTSSNGLMSSSDKSKLNGVESGATADQTDAEIKTAYENNSDTNAFTDALQTKLNGIEDNATADQTAAEILTAIKTVDGAASGLDADTLDGQHASAFLTAHPTISAASSSDNSGRTYIQDLTLDSNGHVTGIATATETVVNTDTNTTSLAIENGSGTSQFTVTDTVGLEFAAGGAASVAFDATNKRVTYSSTNTTYSAATTSADGLMSSSDKTKLDGVESNATADQTGAEIKTAYENEADTNAFTDALLTKLNGIEASADVTDATNVQAAGALMDSELSYEAAVKAIDQDLSTTGIVQFLSVQAPTVYIPNAGGSGLLFEGSTADTFETSVVATDPTADRTITLPDQTGTVMLWQSAWPDDPTTSSNIAIGDNALSSVTSSALYNTAVGNNALTSMTASYRCTAVGYNSLYNVTDGNDNIAIGQSAGYSLTTGDYNTAVGNQAINHNTTDSGTTAVGYFSGGGDLLTGGTFVGYYAGNYNSSSKDYQTAIGYLASNDNYGDYSTAVGAYSMSDGDHYQCTAVGYDALGRSSTSSAWYNIAIGAYSGIGIYSGDNNVFVGNSTNVITTNTGNAVGIGSNAKAEDNCVSVGYQAMYSATTSSDNNVCVGYQAGYDLDGGDYCVFVGYSAGYAGGTGSYNTGTGYNSLDALTTGAYNVASGGSSLGNVTDASSNTGIGHNAGFNVSSGSNNTFLGRNAGYWQDGSGTNGLTTGSNVMCLGYEAVPSSATATNEITLGDNDITTLRCNVTTISSLSDERDKTAIADLTYGLDFINDMRPVEFTWNRRDGSFGAKPDIGFIAQELNDVELSHSSSSRTRLVNWDNPEKLEADYVRSYPILVKAVQELSAKCNALEARIAMLEGN